MTIWIERLRPNDLQVMLPQVLLTLDRIRDQQSEPERRLAVLRSIKDQVEAIHGALPIARPRRGDGDPVYGPQHSLTLEQRLTRSWCNNLQRLLMDLGQPRCARNARYAVYREWTLRQLLRGFAQAIEYAVRTEQSPPAGTWRALHELFVYLEGRDEIDGPADCGRRFDPGAEYKRLLLAGILGDYADMTRMLKETAPKLQQWGASSTLRRGECALGENRLFRVDVGLDSPPRRPSAGVGVPYRGWLLDPPQAFCDYLEHHELRVRERSERVLSL